MFPPIPGDNLSLLLEFTCCVATTVVFALGCLFRLS
jgi:hypothetical protein